MTDFIDHALHDERYKIKQGLISKCEWLPVFDGSEKLFMFLDKDAPKSEVEI